VLGDRGRGAVTPNPDFLRAERFLAEMVEPFHAFFAYHTGPFVIQFPPAPATHRRTPSIFAEELDRFLSRLPRQFRYAVELREESLLTEGYARVLARHGAAHVYNYATAMPLLTDQAAIVPVTAAPFTVIRLLLPPAMRYAERRDALWPFVEAKDPDPEMRAQVVDMVRESLRVAHPVSVLVNNKAEGCAPLTIRALAELLAQGETS
jgi:uncharacterized protein YecE (DUF72 family)